MRACDSLLGWRSASVREGAEAMRKGSGKLTALGFVVFLVGWAPAPPLRAEAPTQLLKSTVDKVIAILQDAKFRGEAKRQERRAQLRKAILPRFDFEEMAKRSLGIYWQRNLSKKQEFVSAFTDFVEDRYVSHIESYKNEKIVYARERSDKEFAEVDTTVFLKHGEEIPIQYALHLVGGDWKVYDVTINHISLVNNYRSQFHRILATSTIDELIQRLQQKRAARES